MDANLKGGKVLSKRAKGPYNYLKVKSIFIPLLLCSKAVFRYVRVLC